MRHICICGSVGAGKGPVPCLVQAFHHVLICYLARIRIFKNGELKRKYLGSVRKRDLCSFRDLLVKDVLAAKLRVILDIAVHDIEI